MQCLEGAEHDFVGDSVKCRKPVEIPEQCSDCGRCIFCVRVSVKYSTTMH